MVSGRDNDEKRQQPGKHAFYGHAHLLNERPRFLSLISGTEWVRTMFDRTVSKPPNCGDRRVAADVMPVGTVGVVVLVVVVVVVVVVEI